MIEAQHLPLMSEPGKAHAHWIFLLMGVHRQITGPQEDPWHLFRLAAFLPVLFLTNTCSVLTVPGEFDHHHRDRHKQD